MMAYKVFILCVLALSVSSKPVIVVEFPNAGTEQPIYHVETQTEESPLVEVVLADTTDGPVQPIQAEEKAEEPAEEIAEEPVQEVVEEPIEEVVEEPIEEVVEEPIEEVVEEAADETVEEVVEQLEEVAEVLEEVIEENKKPEEAPAVHVEIDISFNGKKISVHSK